MVAERKPINDVIRVLLADDHPIMREGVAALLKSQPDIRVVAQAGTGRKAVELYREHRPDVALIDIEMPDGDGPDTATAIRSMDGAARIVILTTYAGEEDVYRSLSAGARGYLLKGEEPDILFGCIRKVASGGRYVPPLVADKLMDRMPSDQLSQRELDVLRSLVEGKTNLEAAAALAISESTVKFHVTRFVKRLSFIGFHEIFQC